MDEEIKNLILDLNKNINARFEQIDKRFEQQEKRLERHEEMIMQLIEIVGHTNKKLDNLIEYQTEKLKFYYKIILKKYVVDP